MLQVRKPRQKLGIFSEMESQSECYLTPSSKWTHPSSHYGLVFLVEMDVAWSEASVGSSVWQEQPPPHHHQRPGSLSPPLACTMVTSASAHGASRYAPGSVDIITTPVYRYRNGDSERVGDLSKVTEQEHRAPNPSPPNSRV